MNKKLKISLAIIIVVIILLLSFGLYVNDYYHADSNVSQYLNGTSNVSVEKISNGLFLDGPGTDNAIIFYPGAKVEYTSYLPLLMNLSSNGVDCFLIGMPFNLAFLGADSADTIVNNNSFNYSHYFLSGHSLGGAISSSYAHDNEKVDGLILLSAYPTDNLSIPVLSIYGSEDKVLNKEKYEDSKSLMSNFTEYIILGGNHAQFGSYGIQDGDGAANITNDEQVLETAHEILSFLNSIS